MSQMLPILGWMLGILPGGAFAQGTVADYDRATRIEKLIPVGVFRHRIAPQWVGSSNAFWYRVESATDQVEYIRIDPDRASKRPLLDVQAIQGAMLGFGIRSNLLGHAFSSFSVSNLLDEIRFRFANTNWLWIGSTRSLTPVPAETMTMWLREVPRRSRRTGDDTQLTFRNGTMSDVELNWISEDGNRVAYGRISPGGSRPQHTFAGHSWLLMDPETRAVLGAATASDSPAELELRPDSPRPTEESRNRTNSANGANRLSGSSSPDGRFVVSVENHNLVLRESGSDEVVRLTRDGSATNAYETGLHWSPNSRFLLTFQTEPAVTHTVHIVESSPKNQKQPKLHSFDYLKPGDRIAHPRPRIVDVGTRKVLAVEDSLLPNPWSLGDVHWAPDASEVFLLYNQRGHQVMRVLAVDPASGRVRIVIEESSPTFIDYAGKFFLRHLDASNEILWMSERDGWNHLWRYDRLKGSVRNQVTSGSWAVRDVLHVDDAGKTIWFYAGGIHSGKDPYHRHLCSVGTDGAGLQVLTEGDGDHRVEFSPDRSVFIDTWSRVDAPPVTELRRTSDGSLLMTLERGDASRLVAAGVRLPERFVAPGRDGKTPIYGTIVRPSNLEPSRKYPVVEDVYAGPQASFAAREFGPRARHHALAELGFIVVQADGMGTSHRSKAFHDVAARNLGDAGFPDRIAWIKAAADRYPEMDITRVGIYGGSAGGQNAMRALIAHHDFYQVAVADCGCHDNLMDKIWWNELWMGWPPGRHFDEASNVTQAHRMQGKLLLIVGELDKNVDPASTMQVADALIRSDKDFDLLVIPGAGHGAAESTYGRRRRMDHLVRHLWRVEPRSR